MLKQLFALGMLAISATASAGLTTIEFNDGDTLADWHTDRSAPAGFEIINNELVMSIGGPLNANDFYNTNGMQMQFGEFVNYFSIDMFIDDAWLQMNQTRFGGIWGIGHTSGTTNSYSIWEYQDQGMTAWVSNVGWLTPPSDKFNVGEYNNLKFTIANGSVQYYLNNELIYVENSTGTDYFTGVILNAKNEGNSYSVRYDNLTYGAVPEPGLFALFAFGALMVFRRRR